MFYGFLIDSRKLLKNAFVDEIMRERKLHATSINDHIALENKRMRIYCKTDIVQAIKFDWIDARDIAFVMDPTL